MRSSLARACCIGVLVAALTNVPCIGSPQIAIASLIEEWSRVRDFTVVVRALERDGKNVDASTVRYAFLKPNHVKAEVLDGRMRGFIAVWNGGRDVTVYRRGVLAGVRMSLAIDDRRVTSLRGNTLANIDLGSLLDCFAEHQSRIVYGQAAADAPDDAFQTVALTLDGSFRCPSDSKRDADVTKDVLYISPADLRPARRVRYSGGLEVERWELTDFQANVGLDVAAFIKPAGS